VRWASSDARALSLEGGTQVPRATAATSGRPCRELETFVAAFEKLASPWRIDRRPAVLDLPAWACAPDLAFERRVGKDVARVYLEVLGFWSREAVCDASTSCARAAHRILFAVSRDLRVSEEILQDTTSAALYVFTRVLGARAVSSAWKRSAPERLDVAGGQQGCCLPGYIRRASDEKDRDIWALKT